MSSRRVGSRRGASSTRRPLAELVSGSVPDPCAGHLSFMGSSRIEYLRAHAAETKRK